MRDVQRFFFLAQDRAGVAEQSVLMIPQQPVERPPVAALRERDGEREVGLRGACVRQRCSSRCASSTARMRPVERVT